MIVALAAIVLAACGSDDSGAGDIGEAADAAKAGRTVEVRQLDSLRFEPATVEVGPGETITFRVTNGGAQIHEFFIGTQSDHDTRDGEMRAMGSSPMMMADRPNFVDIAPGATEELTWTFPQRGEIEFACHQPGHYADGMKGTVRVG